MIPSGVRNGTIQDDEWMIADSVEGGSIGAPLWGYRRTGQHKEETSGVYLLMKIESLAFGVQITS